MSQQQTGFSVPGSHARGSADLTNLPPRAESRVPQLEDEIDFRRYGAFLLRYWIPLVVCALAGTLAGFTIAERRPTLYEAGTTILAHQGGGPVNIANIRALAQNGTLARQTIDEAGLDEAPLSLSPQAFVASVRVDEVPGTNLLKIIVMLPDPEKAAVASRTLAKNAVERNRQLAREEGDAIRTELTTQLDAAADRLNEAEQQLLHFQNEAQVEILRRETDSMLQERGQPLKLLLDIEAEKGRLAAAEAEIQNHKPTLPLRRPVQTGDELRRRSADESRAPMVNATDETLAATDPFVNPIHQSLALEIAMSRIRLAGLEREWQERSKREEPGRRDLAKLADLHRRELQLARLRGNYDLAKQVHAGLMVRYEQAPVETFNRMMTLQVLDDAIRPDRPRPKKRMESAILGLVLGAILGIAGAVGWESWSRMSSFTART